MIEVLSIKREDYTPWLLNRHYARRMCPVSFAFGAYLQGELVGVVTYGTPVASPLKNGVCGKRWADKVLELNRLCCETMKNLPSQLVGKSLKLLPRPSVIVSFADISQGHVGYVYQATNWIYTGLSAKRTDWKVKGMEHLHGATIADKSRGQQSRVEYMRKTYGDDFYLEDRPRKHRYVYFVGSKTERKAMRSALNYTVMPYPKGPTKRYDASALIEKQGVLAL